MVYISSGKRRGKYARPLRKGPEWLLRATNEWSHGNHKRRNIRFLRKGWRTSLTGAIGKCRRRRHVMDRFNWALPKLWCKLFAASFQSFVGWRSLAICSLLEMVGIRRLCNTFFAYAHYLHFSKQPCECFQSSSCKHSQDRSYDPLSPASIPSQLIPFVWSSLSGLAMHYPQSKSVHKEYHSAKNTLVPIKNSREHHVPLVS